MKKYKYTSTGKNCAAEIVCHVFVITKNRIWNAHALKHMPIQMVQEEAL